MQTRDLAILFERDLRRLQTEIGAYADDQALWAPTAGISNPPGNLALHMCGNLRHFIGHILGGSDYIRDRDAEFSATGLSRQEITDIAETTIREIVPVLNRLDPHALSQEFPKEISGMKQTTGFALLHLFGHLSYHLGQVNYHRRITGIHS